MPCTRPSSLTVPENEDALIWRYMDFPKFLSLLDTGFLHFTRGDVLAEKYDKYEGYFNWDELANKEIMIRKRNGENLTGINDPYQIHAKWKGIWVRYDEWKKSVGINCWHVNEEESDAMWKIYFMQGQGISIQSTLKKLCSSFNESKINIGLVNYNLKIEDVFDINKLRDTLWNYYYKRPCFVHEKELRLMVINSENGFIEYNRAILRCTPKEMGVDGIKLCVKLDELIEKVVISPKSPDWYKPLIERILCKYKLESISIEKSEIDKEPDK